MSVRFSAAGRRFSGSGFLFDKDGTLLAFDHWLEVMRERAQRLAVRLDLTGPETEALLRFMGLDPARPGVTNQGIIPLPRCDAEAATAHYLSEACGGGLEEARALVERVFREVDEEFPFERYIRPTPGADAILRAIRRYGGRTAVVTHDTASAARRHLAALGWTDLVDAVIGVDVCAVRKPAPEPVLAACRALGILPEQGVMVGDTVGDLLAGREAGCRLTVGVLTGLGYPEELAPVADLVLPDLTALTLG
ncbi:HAD family hydrolase [Candidatus Bipolaricaulota bacterium]|nr:HAD family hydrolase [Candidatus Bipolaricaulota bacterium]